MDILSKFTRADILPITLAIIDLVCVFFYFKQGDKARAWYWISAASITASTLFIGKK